MKSIKDINIRNKKVLVRVDFNVPIENSIIKDTFRLDAAVPTINYCLSQNASVVLMSHLGRPNGKDSKCSLYPIVEYLEEKFNVYVHFSDDCISEKSVEQSQKMLPKEIHLIENLRYYSEEKENDEKFSNSLSKHADIYIYDAFGLSHRSHASNSSILKFFKMKGIGLLMESEMKHLSDDIDKNTVIVIGGAKISTKIKMINNYLGKASHILIGGAMAFTFLKAIGKNIGLSLCEDNMLSEAQSILDLSKKLNTSVVLPDDFVCSKSFEDSNESEIFNVDDISDDYIGLDIGPETSMNFNLILGNSKKVIWNGPMGMFEKNNYATGTQSVSFEIKELTANNDLISIIGGGDTVRAIKSFTDTDNYTHVSTGGGASLKLLSGEKLDFINTWDKYEQK